MRVYHFVNADYGLENLEQRRLKISTLNELNDPFEFLGVYLADSQLRRSFRIMKNELASTHGLLCFSQNWHNPVLWSHYAAKHTGLCLGFDIPDNLLGEVDYSPNRMKVDNEIWKNPNKVPPEKAKELLFTKYEHWSYENEVRCFVTLEERDSEKGLYFAEFSEDLKLAEVIVGAKSNISRSSLKKALGDLAPSINRFKARLAFKSFKVVRQKNAKLWA